MSQAKDPTPVKGYWVPENVLQGKRWFGVRRRNVIEAAIWVLLVFYLVSLVPFVPRVRWIITVCCCIAVALININGVKDMSISEVVLNFFHYRATRKVYHLRSIDHAGKEQKITNYKATTQIDESNAERIVRVFREKLDEFIGDDEEDWDGSEGAESSFFNPEGKDQN